MSNQIQYGSIWLATGGRESPAGFQINGQQTVQIAPILRSATAGVYGRGNKYLTITFNITRQHASVAAAQTFLWTHALTLPKSGTAVFYQDNEDTVVVADAVLTAFEQSYTGRSTKHIYTLAGRSAEVVTTLPPEDSTMIMGTINIPNGVTEFDVTDLALPYTPSHVGGFMRKPTGGDDLFPTIVESSITTDGWTVTLSASTTDGNYKYTYLISL